jgi:hypothetical protein
MIGTLAVHYEITQLLARYNSTVDQHHFEEWGTRFAEGRGASLMEHMRIL